MALRCLPLLALTVALVASVSSSTTVDLPIGPAEHLTEKDPDSGATLTYLSTATTAESNLYFHERSWTADGKAILFQSQREQGGLMLYLTHGGGLVSVGHALGGLSGATATIAGCGLYALRGQDILHVALDIAVPESPNDMASQVRATVRTLATLPEYEHVTSLNENCSGTLLSVGLEGGALGPTPVILTVDTRTGEVQEVCRPTNAVSRLQHVQWSHTDPNTLSYAGVKPRLMVVDIRDGHPRSVYPEWAEELVTHESWWVRDQIIFCGGTRPKPTEDSHVKLLDLQTGVVRVVGAGTWWAEGKPEAVSRYNWWHADGSDDGRWIVADNWHGDIALFEAKTTRQRLLTRNHRIYGKGTHPHVGFDRAGKSVIFVSHKRGNPDVCVATLPETWQRENPS